MQLQCSQLESRRNKENRNRMHYPEADVSRMYVPRKE